MTTIRLYCVHRPSLRRKSSASVRSKSAGRGALGRRRLCRLGRGRIRPIGRRRRRLRRQQPRFLLLPGERSMTTVVIMKMGESVGIDGMDGRQIERGKRGIGRRGMVRMRMRRGRTGRGGIGRGVENAEERRTVVPDGRSEVGVIGPDPGKDGAESVRRVTRAVAVRRWMGNTMNGTPRNAGAIIVHINHTGGPYRRLALVRRVAVRQWTENTMDGVPRDAGVIIVHTNHAGSLSRCLATAPCPRRLPAGGLPSMRWTMTLATMNEERHIHLEDHPRLYERCKIISKIERLSCVENSYRPADRKNRP